MRGKHFVILSLILFLLCVTAYPILIDKVAITDRVVDRSYHQFLLRASKAIPNKIIVLSGSNSLYAIDTTLLEKHFKRHTIVLADNAGYPLEHKTYNLRNYVSAGDLIILPMEFNHYRQNNNLPDDYVRSVLDKLGSLSFYYNELPYYNKLDFIYNDIPFKLALKRILNLNGFWRFNEKLLQNELYSIYYLRQSLYLGQRGTLLSNNPKGLTEIKSVKTCDDTLFVNNDMDGNFKVSGKFKDNLALLKEMTRETGAEVIFTWPAVAGKPGDECHSSKRVKDKIDEYTRKVVAEVTRHGFKFLGNIEDSRFDSSCILFTYYHIQADCAVERTNRLIDLLEANGIRPATSYSREESQNILNDYLAKVELPLLEKLTPPPFNTPIKINNLTKNIQFSYGWSIPNEYGIWSIDNTSTIYIPKLESKVSSIRFKGEYFNGNEKTGVWINDKFVGNYILTNQTIYVAGRLSDNSYNKIVLEHSNPVAPVDIGYNEDPRKIKYQLSGIEFIN